MEPFDELIELVAETFKHGKHDQSTHGRKRGGGGASSGAGTSARASTEGQGSPLLPPNRPMLDSLREEIDNTKPIANAISSYDTRSEAYSVADEAAKIINNIGGEEYSVYPTAIRGTVLDSNGNPKTVNFAVLGGTEGDNASLRSTLEDNGFQVTYISNNIIDGIGISR